MYISISCKVQHFRGFKVFIKAPPTFEILSTHQYVPWPIIEGIIIGRMKLIFIYFSYLKILPFYTYFRNYLIYISHCISYFQILIIFLCQSIVLCSIWQHEQYTRPGELLQLFHQSRSFWGS